MNVGDLFALLCGFFWSFSVILMRVSGFRIPPLPLTLFKSCIAIFGFVLTLLILREPLLPKISGEAYLKLFVSAVLGISIADSMFASALNRLGASLQALADCIYAPAVAMVGFLMFGEILGPRELIGGSLVVAGVFIGMSLTPEVKSTRDLIIGALFAAGAHIIMAVGILMVRDVYREISVIWVSAFRFIVATAVLGFFLWRFYPQDMFLGFQRRDMWKMMIPMAVLGPFLATLFWVGGFKHAVAGRAAIFNQLSTVFIIILAVLFLKERLTLRKLLGVGLALFGTLLVATTG